MADQNPRGNDDKPSLLVFSDDWGRHPSSCQHLMRQLLGRYRVTWVNTIGMRTPKLDLATLSRAAGKFKDWLLPSRSAEHDQRHGTADQSRPQVVSPRMWPWFTRSLDRRINRRLLSASLKKVIESMSGPVIAVTTLPITAELVGELPVSKWVYYCVDDFSQWPGLDGSTMKRMDDEMLRRADVVVAVSERLREVAAEQNRRAELLTHGVDLEHWQSGVPDGTLDEIEGPVALFWGVIDRRMDVATVRALATAMDRGSIVFVGPQQDPAPELLRMPRCHFLPAQPFDRLPSLAAAADALIMPYADLPVTRAMQPLKLKEYLATGRPTIVNPLPAVVPLADCMDVADSPESFAAAVLKRFENGTPPDQQAARAVLSSESWAAKAEQFECWLLGRESSPSRDTPSGRTSSDEEQHKGTLA